MSSDSLLLLRIKIIYQLCLIITNRYTTLFNNAIESELLLSQTRDHKL